MFVMESNGKEKSKSVVEFNQEDMTILSWRFWRDRWEERDPWSL